MKRRLREAAVLLLLPVALYLFACLISYNPADPSWSHAGSAVAGVHNFGGRVGAWCADLLLYLFGTLAYAFPLLLAVLAVNLLRRRRSRETPTAWEPTMRLIGFVMFFVAGTGL
ncbi:MAG: DNA translocase FtsK 4TM domain-containing protein, partial [Xanthomonadales bacterium]|nr:DNA translocase FtsK 4TM domain-containing protein [Xanthomonadales bacterium]